MEYSRQSDKFKVDYIGPDKSVVVPFTEVYTEEQIVKAIKRTFRTIDTPYQMPNGDILPIKHDLEKELGLQARLIQEFMANLKKT